MNARAEKLGMILAKARVNAGFSQQHIADITGKNRRTIAGWESGSTSPTLDNVLEYFEAIKVNPHSYLIEYIYPKNTGYNTVSEKRELIKKQIDSMSDKGIEDLYLLLSGKNGSSAYCYMQLCVANAQTPLRDRLMVATMVTNNWKLNNTKHTLVCGEEATVDIDALDGAVYSATESVLENMPSYKIKKGDRL